MTCNSHHCAYITLTLSCHDKSDEPSHTEIHSVKKWKLWIIIIMAITANMSRAAIRVITDEPSVPIFHHHCTSAQGKWISFSILGCDVCVAWPGLKSMWERPSPGGTLFVRQEGENDDVLVPHPPPTPFYNPSTTHEKTNPPPSLTHNVDPINTTATKFPLSCVNNLIPFLLAFRLQKVIFQLCRFPSQTRHLPFYDSLSSAAASNQWCWYMLAPEVHDGTKLSSMMSLSPMLIEWLYWKRT